jgi:hypothetical protein
MGFFEDVDALGIVERHIQQVLKLEDSETKKLLRRYKEARRELQDRLMFLPEGSFTAQRVRGVLMQVEAGMSAMNQALKEGIKEVAPDVALKGVEDLISETKAFEKEFRGAVIPINLNAQLVAEDTANFLLNQKEASIDAYSGALRSQIVSDITMASLMQESAGMTVGRMVKSVGEFFIGEEWKLWRIGRTELHNIYNVGKIKGMETMQAGVLPDIQKALMHPMDNRTGNDSKALAVENPIVDIDQPFVFFWKGDKRVFMAPPDRPNDRAILIPYRKSWGAP